MYGYNINDNDIIINSHIYSLYILYVDCLGIACSGGTLANLTALWVARNSCLAPRNQFTGVAKEGLAAGLVEYGYSGACVIGSRMMHYSFRKGVDLLGLGESGLKIVDTDDEFRVKYVSIPPSLFLFLFMSNSSNTHGSIESIVFVT